MFNVLVPTGFVLVGRKNSNGRHIDLFT